MSELAKNWILEAKDLRLPEVNLVMPGLKSFPKEISELVWISQVKAFGTLIKDLSPLNKLINLEELHLYDTPVSNLNPLKGLTNLRKLYLYNTQVKDLGPLQGLPYLEELYITNTPVEDLGPLAGLTNLQILFASSTKVHDLGPLRKLIYLEELTLAKTEVKDLEPISGLSRLVNLDLSNTKVENLQPIAKLIIRGVSVTLKNSIAGRAIRVDSCPLSNPPIEIIKQGNAAILRYFLEKEKGTTYLNEAKLFIVGQGGSGKTSLKRKLIDPNAEMPTPGDTTRGIEIGEWDTSFDDKEIRLHIWDFGGQNIQHYAHQFFLTGSSLYILVTNERTQNPNFQYWLNIIKHLGGKSPVLIVQNKFEGHWEPFQNKAAIINSFDNVLSTFHAVDLCKVEEDVSFNKLRQEILYQASLLPHMGKKYPDSYVRVREMLESLEDSRYFLNWDEYSALCKEQGIDDEALMEDIASVFTILGLCLHFKDDIELKQFVFLNPRWIIDALFKLLYHPLVSQQQGKFSESDTLKIWPEAYYHNMHGKLVRLMENFELCYRIPGEKAFIVPQRLPAAEQIHIWKEEKVAKVIYSYAFLPKGIFTRLICRLQSKIQERKVWADAMIIETKDAKAFVQEVYNDNQIVIETAGKKQSDLLNTILDTMDDIHKKSNYENLHPEKRVPCVCEQCKADQDPFFHNYDELLQILEKGESQERCRKSLKWVNIKAILNNWGVNFEINDYGVLVPDAREIEMQKGYKNDLKIFLSYHQDDLEVVQKLNTHLKILKRMHQVELWQEADIPVGGEIDKAYKEYIMQANIILMLVSANFIASDYIINDLVNPAMKRQKLGEVTIIPIKLKPCDWEGLPFTDFKGFPNDITTNPNEDLAFANITAGLRKLIENWQGVN